LFCVIAHWSGSRSRVLSFSAAAEGGDRLLQPRRPALPLAELFQRIAEVHLRRRPAERIPLARSLRQRRAIGRHRLLEPRRPALPFPQRLKRIAEVHLRRRPVERNPLARPFVKRRVIGRDSLLQPRRPALSFP
jgi:hypothetical protein